MLLCESVFADPVKAPQLIFIKIIRHSRKNCPIFCLSGVAFRLWCCVTRLTAQTHAHQRSSAGYPTKIQTMFFLTVPYYFSSKFAEVAFSCRFGSTRLLFRANLTFANFMLKRMRDSFSTVPHSFSCIICYGVVLLLPNPTACQHDAINSQCNQVEADDVLHGYPCEYRIEQHQYAENQSYDIQDHCHVIVKRTR